MIWLEKIIARWKNFALGFGAATAFTSAVFASFDKLSFVEKAIVSGAAYLVCGLGALIWIRFVETGFTRKRIDFEAAGKSELVARPEEHLAYVANKYARNFYGRRRTITFEQYRGWRRANSYIFTAVVGAERELLGFFDVFPLNDEAGRKIREGIKGEEDISVDDILSENDMINTNFVYIASLMSCVVCDHFEARLVDHMADFIVRHYPPREGRFYVAFAVTTAGKNLLLRNKFIPELNKEITSCKRDLFVLDSARCPDAILRFSASRPATKRRRAKRTKSGSKATGTAIA